MAGQSCQRSNGPCGAEMTDSSHKRLAFANPRAFMANGTGVRRWVNGTHVGSSDNCGLETDDAPVMVLFGMGRVVVVGKIGGDAKVSYQDGAVVVDEEIGCLDIAMNKTVDMEIAEVEVGDLNECEMMRRT